MRHTLWLLLPRPVRRFPADLWVVVVLAALAAAAVLAPSLDGSPLLVALGLPLVAFLPGYALVAALFPRAYDGDATRGAGRLSGGGIAGLERVASSVVASAVVVPLLGFALSETPFGVRPAPVVAAVSGFTVGAALVAAVRRRALPPDERFSVPYERWLARIHSAVLEPGSRTDAALNALLAVSVVVAVASVGLAVTTPGEADASTEFYVLTENGTRGPVADEYPTDLERGEPEPVVVGIDNHEGRQVNYSVVVELQRVSVENGTVAAVDTEYELERYRVTVPADAAARRSVNVTPPATGTRLRLAFLLYRGTPPAEPTAENAYEQLHLWVNVSQPDDGNATAVHVP